MNNAFKNVADTNTAFNNLAYSAVSVKITNYDKLYHQALNLYDELDELRDDSFSLLKTDPDSPKGRIEMIDAIGDLYVFLYGLPHFLGADYIESAVLHNREIRELYQDYQTTIAAYREGPSFFEYVYDDIKTLIDNIINVIQTEKERGEGGGYSELLSAIRDLDTYLLALCESYSIAIDEAIDRITISNMSKLCRDDSETEATLNHYRNLGVDVYSKGSPLIQENGSPYQVVYSSKEQTVRGKEYRAHKFLKCVNWVEPDLSDL